MKGMGATRGISGSSGNGGARGTAGASTGGVEIGIDLGIIKLGISTDYGGGVVVGAFGQEIVWGREGGKIHYVVGPMEVHLEARDCTIVRTDKIAGQTIRHFVYPDPGCKKDKEESEPESEVPKIPKDLTPTPTPQGMDKGIGYVLCAKLEKSLAAPMVTGLQNFNGGPSSGVVYSVKSEGFADIEVVGKIPDIVPPASGSWWPPFKVRSISNLDTSNIQNYNSYGGITVALALGDWIVGPREATLKYRADYEQYSWDYAAYSYGAFFPFKDKGIILSCLFNATKPGLTLFSQNANGGGEWPPKSGNILTWSASGIPVYAVIYYGELPLIRDWINLYNKQEIKITSTGYTYKQLIVKKVVKIGVQLNRPTPKPGNMPPMPNSCCEALKADIEDIKEVFAVREMLKGKCTFPWRLRMPGGQGEEVIKDYPSFLRALAQEIDHLGIHPPKLYIEDNNNAVEGNQTVDIQYPSATSAFEAMMKQVWDDNADGDTRTNFLYRLAWLGIQSSEMTLKLSAKVHALCEGLGIETEVDTAEFSVPFNNAAGVKEKSTRGQGFGKDKGGKGGQIDRSIDANTELAVERLLPDFLKCRDNQVLIERFSGNKDINDKLSLILLHLEKLNSK